MELFGTEARLEGNIDSWMDGVVGTFATSTIPLGQYGLTPENGTSLALPPINKKPLYTLPYLSGEDAMYPGIGIRMGRCDFGLTKEGLWNISNSTWSLQGSLDEILRKYASIAHAKLDAKKTVSCHGIGCWASVLEVLFMHIGAARTCSIIWKINECANIKIGQMFEKEAFDIIVGLFPGLCRLKNDDLIIDDRRPGLAVCLETVAVSLGFLGDRREHGPDDFPRRLDSLSNATRRKVFTVTGHFRWIAIELEEAVCESREGMIDALKYACKIRGITSPIYEACSIRSTRDLNITCNKMQSIFLSTTKPFAVGILVQCDPGDEGWELIRRKIIQYCSLVIINGTGVRGKITNLSRSWPVGNFPPYGVTYKNETVSASTIERVPKGSVILTYSKHKDLLTAPEKTFTYAESPKDVLIVCIDIDKDLVLSDTVKHFLANCRKIICLSGIELLDYACGFLRYLNNSTNIVVCT